MAPTITLNRDKSITVTYHVPDEARQTGIVLQSAGTDKRGRVSDGGFYADGRKLQELADQAEHVHQWGSPQQDSFGDGGSVSVCETCGERAFD